MRNCANLSIVLAGLVLGAGCQVDLGLPRDVRLTCSGDITCPSGYRCNASTELCVPTDREDLQPPVVKSASLSTALAGRDGAGFESVVLSLVVNEPLAGEPRVFFQDGETRRHFADFAPLDAPPDGGHAYQAIYAPTGEETQQTFALEAVLEDAVGNRFEGTLPASVGFDFELPDVVQSPAERAPTVALLPDPTQNPLAREVAQTTRTASQTTRVLVTFTVTEAVVEPVLQTSAETDLAFSLFGRSGNTWTFEVDWAQTSDAFEGTYELVARLTDEAGNQNEVPLSGAALRLDTVPPAPPAVDGPRTVRFVRAPWGRRDFPATATFALEGKPGAVAGEAWVLAFSTADAVTEIGRVRANTQGAFGGPDGTPPFTLATGDAKTVYLRVADAAGNPSTDGSDGGPATAVRDVVWIAGPGGKVAGDVLANPHGLDRAPYLARFRDQSGFTPIGGDALAAVDGTTLETTAGGSWWELDTQSKAIGSRTFHGMAYDPTSGRSYVAGGIRTATYGNPSCGSRVSPTFDFRSRGFERNWREPAVSGYSDAPAYGHTRLVYDGTRELLMMRGSNGQFSWDGTRWNAECVADACGEDTPALNFRNRLTYDPANQRVVLLAPLSGVVRVYHWDGSTWAQACTDAPCTDARPTGIPSAVAYDENLSETLLFGAGPDGRETWSWKGERWLQRCTEAPCAASRPPARAQAAMAFDRTASEMMLFGGNATGDACSFGRVNYAPPEEGPPEPPLADTWVFDGSTWTPKTPAESPPARYGHAMLYDGQRQRVILHGGTHCDCYAYDGQPSTYADVWAWNGTTWSRDALEAAPSDWYAGAPEGSSHHAMSTDPNHDRVVMVGGALGGGLWGWMRGQWYEREGAGQQNRDGAPMQSPTPVGAASPVGPVMAAGGDFDDYSLASPYTFVLEGDSWPPACGGDPCVSNPAPQRTLHAVASDGDDLILFGGTDWQPSGSPPTGGIHDGAKADTWRYAHGTGWLEQCTSAPCTDAVPPARSGHAMAYTGTPGRVLMFGGAQDMNGALADTWLWVDDHWEELTTAGDPEPRVGHRMLYDPSRERVILYGGTDDPGSVFVANAQGGYDEDAAQHLIPLAYDAVWEWQGGEWREVASVTPRPGDTPPGLRYYHGAAWAPTERGMLVYGGNTSPETHLFGVDTSTDGSGGTWLWRPGTEGRPALRFQPNLSLAGQALRDHLAAVEVRWHGSARSYDGGQEVSEPEFRMWDGRGWRRLPTAPCGDDCRAYDSTNDPRIASASVLRRYIEREHMRLVLSTAGTTENRFERARLETDYFEMRVWYRLP